MSLTENRGLWNITWIFKAVDRIFIYKNKWVKKSLRKKQKQINIKSEYIYLTQREWYSFFVHG